MDKAAVIKQITTVETIIRDILFSVQIIVIVLKLTHVINWPWNYVLLPLAGFFGLLLFAFLVLFATCIIAILHNSIDNIQHEGDE